MIDLSVVVVRPSGATRRRVHLAWNGAPAATRLAVLAGFAMQLAVAGALLVTASTRPFAALALALAAPLFAAAALVDTVEQCIPNRLVGAASIVVVLAAAAAGSATTIAVALGAVLAAAPMSAVVLGRGVGMGDLKLAAALGAAGGFVHPGVGLGGVFVAALCSAAFARSRGIARLALAPWLWGGWLVAAAAALVQTAGS